MRQRYPRWLKRVSQLGPEMVRVLTDWDGDPRESFAESNELAKAAGARFNLPSHYLTSRLHDGGLTELSIKGDRLRMAVSHLDFEWICCELKSLPGCRNFCPAMPVTYDFKACSLIKTYRVDDSDNLRPFTWRRLLKSSAVFLYAGVVPSEKPNLVWACVLWTNKTGHVVVVVESALPSINDSYLSVWAQTLGEEWIWVAEAYREIQHNNSFRIVDLGSSEFLNSIGLQLKEGAYSLLGR